MYAALDKKKKEEEDDEKVSFGNPFKMLSENQASKTCRLRALSARSVLWVLSQLLPVCASVSPLGEEGAVPGTSLMGSAVHVSDGPGASPRRAGSG